MASNLKHSPALLRTLAAFQALGDVVFSAKELEALVREEREAWGLPDKVGPKAVLEFLLERNQLRQVALAPLDSKYEPISRYVQGDPTPFEVAVSISHGYLCHASALYVHGLTNLVPSVIYVNREQTPKPAPEGELSQDAIDRAFRSKPRRTNFVFLYEGIQLAILSGKHTGALEVVTVEKGPFKGLPVTATERTLIDITVRPEYAGGVVQVAQAFERAKGLFSAKRLHATLKKLRYVYPYHQAIGFYLERANYPAPYFEPLRALGLEFDFYLTHGVRQSAFNAAWRIHHPEGL